MLDSYYELFTQSNKFSIDDYNEQELFTFNYTAFYNSLLNNLSDFSNWLSLT